MEAKRLYFKGYSKLGRKFSVSALFSHVSSFSLKAILLLALQLGYSGICHAERCPAFAAPPPGHQIVDVSSAQQLTNAVAALSADTTIRLAPGIYQINSNLNIARPRVTLRSATGNRDDVIIDGNYQAGEILNVTAPDFSVADLTLRRAYYHAVHLNGGAHRARLYNVKILDSREQFVKSNPNSGQYNDFAEIACSHFELTDAGRSYIHSHPTPGYLCYTGGIDAHSAQDWRVRDNVFRNIHCTNGGLAEHCVHFWKTSLNPTVERNIIHGCARGIGFGLGSAGGHRTYSPNPIEGLGINPGHIGGVIRNNSVFASIGSFYDSGIGLEQAWGVTVEHNTIYSANGDFNSAIDMRFNTTNPVIRNNLYWPQYTIRDGATPTLITNLLGLAQYYVNLPQGDLHLSAGAAPAINAATPSGLADDFEGDPRGATPDIGCDELGTAAPDSLAPAPPGNLRVSF